MDPDITQEAHEAFCAATREAEWWGDTNIAADHLVVALLRGQETSASSLLTHFEIELDLVLARLERYLSWDDHEEQAPIRAAHARQLGDAGVECMLPRTSAILDYAAAEAARHGHPRVGTGHLLFGVVREGGSLGSWLLLRVGLHPATLSAELAARPPEGEPAETDPIEPAPATVQALGAVAKLGLLGLVWCLVALVTLVSILEQRSNYLLWPTLLRSAWAGGIALGAVRPGMRLERQVWPRMQALLFASSAGSAVLLTAAVMGLATSLARLALPLGFYATLVVFTNARMFRSRTQFGVGAHEGWRLLWREGGIYLVVSAILELATLVSYVLRG